MSHVEQAEKKLKLWKATTPLRIFCQALSNTWDLLFTLDDKQTTTPTTPNTNKNQADHNQLTTDGIHAVLSTADFALVSSLH